jgi:ADP-ribose pyrophosphatase YjhB (NUDIX family)
MSSPDDRSLYKATPRWPAHLSATVVLLNDRGDVAMHYWAKSVWGDDLYSLMHETVHNGEPLEQAAARGLQEEWGVTGKIVAYLGTHTMQFTLNEQNDRVLHKALPSFLARFVSVDASLRQSGPEGESKLVWLTFNKAAEIMARQAKRFPERPDLDESVILGWARQYLKRGQ